MSDAVPVIAVDGPVGAGKGTVSKRVAERLGFHLLDSGAIYRVLALASQRLGIAFGDRDGLVGLARELDVRFERNPGGESLGVLFEGEEVGTLIRDEGCGQRSSQLAADPTVRVAVLQRQRAFRRPPGLVADGRDMGTVVFPDASLKVYLTASIEERARRRHKQLVAKGFGVSLPHLLGGDQPARQAGSGTTRRPVAAGQRRDHHRHHVTRHRSRGGIGDERGRGERPESESGAPAGSSIGNGQGRVRG